MHAESRNSRRFFRFSLRTLLILITLFAVAFGYLNSASLC